MKSSLGQKIPTGLHVRLNLETGLREAKLLDNEEQSSSTNEIISVPNDESSELSQEELSRQNLEKAFANLDLTKDDVPTDQVNFKTTKFPCDFSISLCSDTYR